MPFYSENFVVNKVPIVNVNSTKELVWNSGIVFITFNYTHFLLWN